MSTKSAFETPASAQPLTLRLRGLIPPLPSATRRIANKCLPWARAMSDLLPIVTEKAHIALGSQWTCGNYFHLRALISSFLRWSGLPFWLKRRLERRAIEGTRVGSRTAAATRMLVRAVRDDVAVLFHQGRRDLSSIARWSHDRLLPYVKSVHACAGATLRAALGALQVRRLSSPVLHRLTICLLVLTIFGSFMMATSTLWVLQEWPTSKPLHDTGRPPLLLEAYNGEPLGWRGIHKLSDVDVFPRNLTAAVVCIEDHRFYNHDGVDLVGITRALYRNIAAGGVVEGGSTITQQLMKIKYLGRERSYARKLREAVMSIAYEWRHSKREILTEYLNRVYLGQGVYGMPAAARLYFDKPLSELTLSEAAMLAGMIRSPSQFNPIRDLQAAQARAGEVIDAMREYGLIDETSAREAKASPALVVTARARSWFTDWADNEASGLADVYTETTRVRTTLVPRLQHLAEQVVNDVLTKEGPALHASQAALVAMRPDGAVVAMVGGRDYDKSQFNRAVEANRQPGSAFKLFVYLAALRNGYSPESLINARPLSIRGWTPKNYGGHQYGTVTLFDAFARSINTAAVRLAMQVGLEKVIAAARDLGIDAPLEAYPSLALGATGVSLIDLTGAYASVRAGRRVQPWAIAALGTGVQSDLRAVGGNSDTGKALGPERDAMIALLRRVVESGTGRRAALDGFAAGKTGTSQDYRDAWFVGFNDALVSGVWIGNDDNSPMKHVVGGSLPAMIWQRFMAEATKLIAQDQVHVAASSRSLSELPEGVLAQATEGDLNPTTVHGGYALGRCTPERGRNSRPASRPQCHGRQPRVARFRLAMTSRTGSASAKPARLHHTVRPIRRMLQQLFNMIQIH
jgi:penicillin-binding protein 1A